jgi:hypothetical protein
MRYESQEEKNNKIILIIVLIIMTLVFYKCTGNSDPLHHSLIEGSEEIIEHIK